MEKGFAVFTIFTFLLFAVSTARIAVDTPIVTESSADSGSQTFDVSTVDPTQHLRFLRLHPVNRHFSDKTTTRTPLRFIRRHPCRKFMMPTNKISYGSDMILSGKTYSLDPKAFGDQIPTEWLEFKHNYGHRHHHEHHHDKDEEFHMFDLVSSSGHHHKEKREHKGGFMRRIRKFLKHTFD